MAKTYPLAELANLLRTDPKTLRRWIEREGWDMTVERDAQGDILRTGKDVQVSNYDRRIKVVTEAQAAQLAKAHDRVWPPMPRTDTGQGKDKAVGLPGVVGKLRDDVDKLERDHVTREEYDYLMDKLTTWATTTADLVKRVIELEHQLAEAQPRPKAGRKPKAQGEPGEALAD